MDLINNRSTSKINLTRLEMTIMHRLSNNHTKGPSWSTPKEKTETSWETTIHRDKGKTQFLHFPVHILSLNLSPNINIHVASRPQHQQAVCLRYFIINLFISPDKLLINGNGGLAQLGNLCLNKSPALKVLQNCQARVQLSVYYLLKTSRVLLNTVCQVQLA